MCSSIPTYSILHGWIKCTTRSVCVIQHTFSSHMTHKHTFRVTLLVKHTFRVTSLYKAHFSSHMTNTEHFLSHMTNNAHFSNSNFKQAEKSTHSPIRIKLRIHWDDTFSRFHQCIRLGCWLGWKSKAAAVTFFQWFL